MLELIKVSKVMKNIKGIITGIPLEVIRVFGRIKVTKSITANILFKATRELKYLLRIIRELKDSIKISIIAISSSNKIFAYLGKL